MKKTMLVFIAIMCAVVFTNVNVSAKASLAGTWYNIDDETGKAKSHILIVEKNGVYYGKILKLLTKPQDTKCDKCKGSRKDKPVVGMVMLWGMKTKDGKLYEGGRILDPGNGKNYRCKMWLQGNKIKVRGYIAFFYRTQYWHRVK